MQTDIKKLEEVALYLRKHIEWHFVDNILELIALALSAAEDLKLANAIISDLREEAHGLRPLNWIEVSTEELVDMLAADYTLAEICSTDEWNVMLHLLRKGILWPGYGGIKYVIRMARDKKSREEVVK